MTNLSLLNAFGTTEIVLLSIFGAIIIGFIVYVCFIPLKNYFTALFSKAYVSSFKLISLKNRKFDVNLIVNAYIRAKKAKLGLRIDEIEKLNASGGDVNEVIKAMSYAKDANINLDFELASTIELSSHDVFNVVTQTVVSKLEKIEDIRGITQDNIEIVANAQISVKINLQRYIEGSGLEDLKGVISAWIMENISKQASSKTILKEPNITLLSNFDLKLVTKKSMFDIIDISISSVSVDRDLNIEKEIKAAEKEKIYAQIESERMKNAEEIKEIKMRSKTEEMKASVLQAEAEVPHALSEAIKEGRFSVMDYYKLMNLQADTALRRAFINDKKSSSNDFLDDDGDDF